MSNDHWILHRIWQSREPIMVNLSRPNVQAALATYTWLQSSLPNADVTKDPFRAKFIRFYRLRFPAKGWLDRYFCLLEEEKCNGGISFADVLGALSTPQLIQASFCSKLVATVRPEMPVIDQYVIANLGLGRVSRRGVYERRIQDWIDRHAEICLTYEALLKQSMYAQIGRFFAPWFDRYVGLTDAKKLDVLLWQMR